MEQANPQHPQGVPPVGPARNNNKIMKYALWAAAALFGLFMVLLFLLMMLFKTQSAGLIGILVGIVVATLPVPLYLALALWIDRFEKEPIWMLAGAFVWGVVVADTLSFFLNTINGMVVGSLTGGQGTEFFGAVISAPIVEEVSKGLALLILFWWKKDEFDGVIDGIVYAAMVGLGFAMAENFGYYGRAMAEGGVVGSLLSFLVRGVFSPFLHPIFTAMTGIGLGIARRSNNTLIKFAAPLAGLTVAIILHAIWNGSGFVLTGLAGLAFSMLVLAPLFMICILAIVAFSLQREGRIIKQYLTPELQSGLVTQQEYDSLGSVRGHLGSSLRALRGGFGPWRAHSRFVQAAAELAFHRDRVRRGITSVDAAAREAAYVQTLQQLRGQQVA